MGSLPPPAKLRSAPTRYFPFFLSPDMDQARVFFSLRWKILAWFFVNLLVLGAMLFLFLRVQFRVGINSLLAGPTSDRLETVARPLVDELRTLPESGWDAALTQAVEAWRERGLRVALFRDDGTYVAGDIRELPAEVSQTLVQHEARNHRMMHPPGGRDGHPHGPPPDHDRMSPPDRWDDGPMHEREDHHEPPPGPPPGPREGASAPAASTGPLEKFMLVAGEPRLYWAGVHLGEMRRPPRGGGSPSVTLLLASESLRGGGLFFDYVPWLVLGGGLVGISVLMWLPFVHGLTRSLSRMTQVAEHIAHGRFEPPHLSRRRDELGRLGRALGHMAARLEGFVTGQKRFLGDTAHELLTPLARLELALSILEQKTAVATSSPYAVRALAEVRHISTLVHELLSFTKAGLHLKTAELERVNLATLAREVVVREHAADKVVVEIAADLHVRAASDLLARAVANVVRNAVRYAGDAGPIRVSAETVHGEGEGNGEDTVALRITDEGPGVPPEALDRLFDPFYRPETARTRETGGVGLGLAIVKSCVEACGGQVEAKNRSPHGLELIMILLRAK